MAKKKKSNYDKLHQKNLTTVQKKILEVFDEAISEAATIGAGIPAGDLAQDTLFSFSAFPSTAKKVEKLLNTLQSSMMAVITNSIRSEWTLANNKNDELSRQVFGDNVGKLSQAQYRRYFSTNGNALDAFLQRKENGLSLSDRVWKYTDAYKSEIELGLDVGIRNGMSAPEMTKELRQYLQYPDKLFRRVRDEHGDLQLSRNAAMFHPGQGVYRSSYMNARRLAATETNIAYRTSDYLRWQDQDFVVGIHVLLSNNHTCLGPDGKPHAYTDMCDELSGTSESDPRGRYPKDFKFVGWHPHCRCYAISILKTDEEIQQDNERILNGEDPTEDSVNTIDRLPDELIQWVQDNEGRIHNNSSIPYFMRDNQKMITDVMSSEEAIEAVKKSSPET